MANLEGVGPDAETVVNEVGAGSSHTPYRFDLLPALAIADVARTMAAGAVKYGVDNWKLLETQSHLNHAMQHIFAFIAGDTQEGDVIEHARHAATRILFWLDKLETEEQERTGEHRYEPQEEFEFRVTLNCNADEFAQAESHLFQELNKMFKEKQDATSRRRIRPQSTPGSIPTTKLG